MDTAAPACSGKKLKMQEEADVLQVPIRALMANASRAGEREQELLRAAIQACEQRLADLLLIDAAPPPPRQVERAESVLKTNGLRGFYAYAVGKLGVIPQGPEGSPNDTYVCVKFGIAAKVNQLATRISAEAQCISKHTPCKARVPVSVIRSHKKTDRNVIAAVRALGPVVKDAKGVMFMGMGNPAQEEAFRALMGYNIGTATMRRDPDDAPMKMAVSRGTQSDYSWDAFMQIVTSDRTKLGLGQSEYVAVPSAVFELVREAFFLNHSADRIEAAVETWWRENPQSIETFFLLCGLRALYASRPFKSTHERWH